jgi:hypothetical protein
VHAHTVLVPEPNIPLATLIPLILPDAHVFPDLFGGNQLANVNETAPTEVTPGRSRICLLGMKDSVSVVSCIGGMGNKPTVLPIVCPILSIIQFRSASFVILFVGIARMMAALIVSPATLGFKETAPLTGRVLNVSGGAQVPATSATSPNVLGVLLDSTSISPLITVKCASKDAKAVLYGIPAIDALLAINSIS